MARPRKLWSVTVGSHGHRVTACERTHGGPISLRWWDAERANWSWRSLKHCDREFGERQARELAGQLLASTIAAQTGRCTLAEVFAAYERDVSSHHKGQGPQEARRRMAIWQQFLGADRDASAIDFASLDRFVSAPSGPDPRSRRYQPGRDTEAQGDTERSRDRGRRELPAGRTEPRHTVRPA